MTSAATLLKICQVLVDNNAGEYIQAEHDIIYLAAPDSLSEEVGKQLEEAGADYDPREAGWHVTT